MSWETVRHVDRMKPTLLVIRNLATQNSAPEDVLFWVQETASILAGVLSKIEEGEIL